MNIDAASPVVLSYVRNKTKHEDKQHNTRMFKQSISVLESIIDEENKEALLKIKGLLVLYTTSEESESHYSELTERIQRLNYSLTGVS